MDTVIDRSRPPSHKFCGSARSPTARARGLQLLGVQPGIHVGLYLPNTPHYAIAFFGVLKAGGTVVNHLAA